MIAPVSHSIRKPPFEDLESGLPSSDYMGAYIWLNSYNILDSSIPACGRQAQSEIRNLQLTIPP